MPRKTGAVLTLGHVAAFLVIWALLHLAVGVFRYPELLTGAQLDSDGYMRLIRVQTLLAGSGWFEPMIAGSNWPYGEVIHWTRPLDVLLLALALPGVPFLGWERAIAVSGTLFSPLVHAAICVSAAWAVAPLVVREVRPLALPVMLSMAGVLAYATAGRADHHALLLLLTLVALGGWMRALEGDRPPRHASLTGGVMALALWISPESLVPLAAIFLSGGLAWILQGEGVPGTNLRMAAFLLVGLVLAVLVERPPSDWLAVEFDRVSLPHMTMAGIAVLFWGWVRHWGGLGKAWTVQNRAAAALVGGGASVATLLLVHPGFHRGPAAEADPVMAEIFFPYVNELRSLLPVDSATAGEFVTYIGAPIVALGVLLGLAWSSRGQGVRPAWVVLATALALFIPMGTAQVRLVGYAGLAGGLGIMVVVDRLLPWISDRLRGWPRRVARLGALLGLTVGFVLLGGLLALGDPDPEDAAAGEVAQAECSIPSVAGWFRESGAADEHPGAVALSINHGPELLYRAGVPILSGPYHRNHEGMVALNDILTDPDLARARRIAIEREVAWVLLCPATDTGYFGRGEEGSLFHRLVSGDPPDWASIVELVPPGTGGFLLFQIHAREAGGS